MEELVIKCFPEEGVTVFSRNHIIVSLDEIEFNEDSRYFEDTQFFCFSEFRSRYPDLTDERLVSLLHSLLIMNEANARNNEVPPTPVLVVYNEENWEESEDLFYAIMKFKGIDITHHDGKWSELFEQELAR